jgi:hypothetical protein
LRIGKRGAQQRVGAMRLHALLEVAMANRRTNRDVAVGDVDARKLGDPVDVDEGCRRGEPKIHGRDQALAAGQHHGAGSCAEMSYCILGGTRDDIVEHRWFHRRLPA